MEVIEISKSIEPKDLENTVWKTFNSICFDIREDRINKKHQLTKWERIISKFSQRKNCQHLMHIKKGLKYLNPTNLSFPGDTKIYVNNSLCPSFRGLRNECKKLGIIRKESLFVLYCQLYSRNHTG